MFDLVLPTETLSFRERGRSTCLQGMVIVGNEDKHIKQKLHEVHPKLEIPPALNSNNLDGEGEANV